MQVVNSGKGVAVDSIAAAASCKFAADQDYVGAQTT
jgi:hypothetical protein